MKNSFQKLFFAAILLFTPMAAVAQAEPAGQVIDLQGEVRLTPAGGAPKPAALKQSVSMGDKLETKAAGAVKILFVDDTILTLKENSKALITEFLFDAKAGKRKAVLNVLGGKARTVVGKFFGDDQTVEIKTPTAVAGIRGTDVGAVVQPSTTTFYCFDGKFTSYNIDYPDKEVTVTEGLGISIFEGVPAAPENLVPIPADIQPQSFDISLTTQEKEEETEEAAAEEEKKEEKKETPPSLSSYGVEGSGKYGSYGSSYGMYSSPSGYTAYSSGMSSSYGSVSFSQYMVYSTSQSASTEMSSSAFDGMSSWSSGSAESQSMYSAGQAQSYESTYTSGAYGGWGSSDTQVLPGGETEATSTTSDTSGVDVEFP